METKSFRVTGLPTCYHTPETKEIFKKHVNGDVTITQLITLAIVEYAKQLGFAYPKSSNLVMIKPEYINDERFAQIQYTIDKSKEKDYTYLVAFEYLRWKRPGVSKSNLQRDAIKNFC